MEYTEAEKREAFASFDDYAPRFKATLEGFVPGVAHDRTILDNPLVGMIYADGFLHGRHSGDKPEGVKRLRERCRDLTAMIEELAWAMVQWSRDEDDSIHPDAYPAFRAACALVGVPITDEATPGGEFDYVYRFDPGWSERQREQWRQRMAAHERV